MSERLKILLVEDSEIARDYVKSTLKSAAIDVDIESAGTIEEGVQAMNNGEFDCVLLDFWLPDGDSFQFLDRVRSEGVLKTPVVILTARDDDETAISAMRHGVEDYLVKGRFDGDLLARSIRYAIERDRVKQELDAAKRRLERLAIMDPLTELLNRRGLQQVLSREFRHSQRNGTDIVTILIDLDDFKRVNDAFGYTAGDVVLTEVSRRLVGSLRASDFACRIGGDEFMILLPETRLGEGIAIAEKIRLGLSKQPVIFSSGKSTYVTASMGVVSVANTAPTIDALLAATQDCVQQSKHQGKDRVTANRGVQPGQDQPVDDGALQQVLHALNRGDGFRVVAQPIIRLADESVAAHEFLSRLSTPIFEMPIDFFAVAMNARIVTAVDYRCFLTCLKASRSDQFDQCCHINLFPSTMLGTPTEHLVEAIAEGGEGKKYCIEISEQQIIGDPSSLYEAVQIFRRAGVLLAIDDVGFGRSCLESLVLLEPDVVKIDKRFITGVRDDAGRMRSLERLTRVLRSLEVEIIAEGVESAHDVDALNEIGIELAQGYYFARPTPC